MEKTINRKWLCNATKCVQIEWWLVDGKDNDGTALTMRRVRKWNDSKDFVAHDFMGWRGCGGLKCMCGCMSCDEHIILKYHQRWILFPFTRKLLSTNTRDRLCHKIMIGLFACVNDKRGLAIYYFYYPMFQIYSYIFRFKLKWLLFYVNHSHWIDFSEFLFFFVICEVDAMRADGHLDVLQDERDFQ